MAHRITISYHTDSDSAWANALSDVLGPEGVIAQKLDYLTLSGFSLPDGPVGGRLRKDCWIDHYAHILDGSVGMVVIRSELSRASETTAGRGMWVEQQLARQLQGTLQEFIRVLDIPLHTLSGPVSTPERWAADKMYDLRAWVRKRQQAGPVRLVRFDSEIANIKQPYFNYEIQYAGMRRTWFFISILDLYDRVWHCRCCMASSDVWLGTESRPPGKCPACGYSGNFESDPGIAPETG